MRRRRSAHGSQRPCGRSRQADPAQTQATDLARLAALHDSGALTDEEYARAKSLALS